MAYPTNPIYKLVKDPFTDEVNIVKTQKGESEPCTVFYIPFDEENVLYQEYLEWAKTNTAEAAD